MAARARHTAGGPPFEFRDDPASKVLDYRTQESSLGMVFHFATGRSAPAGPADLVAVLKYLDSDEGKTVLKQIVD
jgi:hypothetical protein